MTAPERDRATRTRTATAAATATSPRRATKAAVNTSTTVEDAARDTTPADFRSVAIENVTPELDSGRYAVKREVGETFVVEADLFKEGHDLIAARVAYLPPGETTWRITPMTLVDNDRWRGSFELAEIGR